VDLQEQTNPPPKPVKHIRQSQLTKTVANRTLQLCPERVLKLDPLLMRRRARDGTSAQRSRRPLGPSPGRKPQAFKCPIATTRPTPLSKPHWPRAPRQPKPPTSSTAPDLRASLSAMRPLVSLTPPPTHHTRDSRQPRDPAPRCDQSLGVVGDGDGDDPFYRHNRVSIATTRPSNSSANRYRSSSTAPRTRTTSITAAHSIADPRAIA